MTQFAGLAFGLVDERDLQPGMDVRNVFEMLADDVGIEMHAAENVFVRPKEDAGAMPAKRPHLLDRRRRFAALVTLHPFVPVAVDGGDHFLTRGH